MNWTESNVKVSDTLKSVKKSGCGPHESIAISDRVCSGPRALCCLVML